MPDTFDYNDDIIDSRDLYKRQQELDSLKSEVEDAQAEYDEAVENFENDEGTQEAVDDALKALKDAQDEFALPEQQELDMLNNLENEIDDWMHGTTLIEESHFPTYAKQYASDVAEMPDDLRWPFNCIDWDRAAEELKSDFTEVTIDGNTFYYS